MHKLMLFGIVLLGLLLRIIFIDKYPIGFTPDEASFGYDAYSILHTGRDQWGVQFPLILKSFGDYKLPLYSYLAIPSISLFGLNEFATRLPNALIGSFAILSVYLLTRKLFDKKTALLAAFLLAISPWHISLSRGAFEANLTTFFLPFGLWAYLKGLSQKAWMSVAVLSFGLNLFSYHSARIVTPLVVITVLFFTYKELGQLKRIVKTYPLPLLLGILFIFLVGLSFINGANVRGGDIAIFNPTGGWGAVADRRYTADILGLPDAISKLFSNKVTYVTSQFITNYVSYMSGPFFLTQGAGEWTYGMIPGVGLVYLFEGLFLITTLLTLKTSIKSNNLKIIVIWLLLSPIPAALTKGPGFAANRAEVMIPALQILSAYGGITLYKRLKNRKLYSSQLLPVFAIIVLISLISFLENYFYHAPVNAASSMLYGRGEAVKSASSLESKYKEVVFSKSLSEPQIYVAFYKKWNPTDYQNQTREWEQKMADVSFVDQIGEYKLGNYTFTNIDINRDKDKNYLFVGKPEEFGDRKPLQIIKYLDTKPAIYLVQ